jgi:hypothetical protein
VINMQKFSSSKLVHAELIAVHAELIASSRLLYLWLKQRGEGMCMHG